jgi:hypothetical protein
VLGYRVGQEAEMSKSEAVELKRVLRQVERGRGKRVASEVKQRVARYGRARREAGAGYREIARELGLSVETARRWCSTAEASGSRPSRGRMVRVEVVPERGRAAVVSPSGYRVEGLTLEEVAALLRALP